MYPIADMLIRIKNAQAVRHEQVLVPFSKVKFAVAQILQSTGYINSVERVKKPARPGTTSKIEHEYLLFTLKYQDGLGALNGVKIISRPSRHMYVSAKEVKPVRSGHGVAVISTSQGIMSSKEAKKQKIGGEILFEIW